MFVQEEKIFAGKVLKIHVCTMDGTEWLEEVTEDTTVEKLKERCLKHVGYWVCLCPPPPPCCFFGHVNSAWDVCKAPVAPCKLSVSVTLALYL